MATETSPTYRVIYFDFPGRAESIRLTFALAGVPFEDVRFKERAELEAWKASGRLMFGQVPALEIVHGDDATKTTVLNQTAAIMRFAAQLRPETALYPADAVVAATVDAIVDQRADAYAGLNVSKYKERFGFGFLREEKHAELVDAAQTSWNKEIMPKHLATLAKLLERGGTGWLAGTQKPTIADVLWAPDLIALRDGKSSGDTTVLDAFPTLLDFCTRFYDLPAVKAYYADKSS